jgi:hypothetical protein
MIKSLKPMLNNLAQAAGALPQVTNTPIKVDLFNTLLIKEREAFKGINKY